MRHPTTYPSWNALTVLPSKDRAVCGDGTAPSADVPAADQLFAGALMSDVAPTGWCARQCRQGGGDVVQFVKRPRSTASATPGVLMSRALPGGSATAGSTQVYS